MPTTSLTSEVNPLSVEKVKFNLKVELDDERPIYVSGNFNNWELKSEKFLLHRTNAREYELAWPKEVKIPNQIEYKYLKGGWESVELDRYGNRIENRRIDNPNGKICDFISRWRIEGLAFNKEYLPYLI